MVQNEEDAPLIRDAADRARVKRWLTDLIRYIDNATKAFGLGDVMSGKRHLAKEIRMQLCGPAPRRPKPTNRRKT